MKLPAIANEWDFRFSELLMEDAIESRRLLWTQMGFAFADSPLAQERIQPPPMLPHLPRMRVELTLVLLHEGKTAPLEDHRETLRRDIEPSEGDDLPQTAIEVSEQVL